MRVLKSILVLAMVSLAVVSCSDSDNNPIDGEDTMAFEGAFSREFEVQGAKQRATYTVAQRKITYDLSGGFAATNYELTQQYYASDDNRWIGVNEENGTFYVIFFKNVEDNQITLYKQEVASLEEGKRIETPASDNTDNYGWNTYTKNLPISGKIENLHAEQSSDYSTNPPTISGDFVKFSFKEGGVVTGDDWDIAFRGTTILVNGGEKTGLSAEPERTGDAAITIKNSTYEDYTSVADDTEFKQDAEGALGLPKSTWYSYDRNTHIIAPTGKVIVVKTIDGNYAKLGITSYYKDSPENPDYRKNESQYYTFNYTYITTPGDKSFQ